MKVIYITTAIVFLFITGILQWNLLEIEWKYFTFFQALHVISALFISFFRTKELIGGKRIFVYIVFGG